MYMYYKINDVVIIVYIPFLPHSLYCHCPSSPAFTELQTELQDVVKVQDKNYPYRDFRSFAMKFLFPIADGDHSILRPVKVTQAIPTNHVEHVTTVTIGARSVSKTYPDWLSCVSKQLPVSYFATKHYNNIAYLRTKMMV